MTGQPCCCVETECELTPEELPVPSIPGMTLYSDWSIVGCCATAIFTYDEEQPLTILDGGDVMTYDKTESWSRELFYFPKTCPTITQATWTHTSGELGATDEIWTAVPGDEPAYVDCCNAPVSVNILTTTFRSQGGQRFVVSTRPTQITVVIQKTLEYVCDAGPPATMFILKGTVTYSAHYEYIDYAKDTVDYTLADSDPNCWVIPTNTSVTTHSFPFDIELWDGMGGSSIYATICRERFIGDALHAEELVYAFVDGDCLSSNCTYPTCSHCVCDDNICFDSGMEGQETPAYGFCDANVLVVVNEDGPRAVDCLQHRFYYWGHPGQTQYIITPGGPPYMPLRPSPPDFYIHCLIDGVWGVTADFQDGGSGGAFSVYGDLPPCDYVHSYDQYTTINGGAGSIISPGAQDCPTFSEDALANLCYPTYTCDTCITAATSSDDPFDLNTPWTPDTVTELYDLICRNLDYTRTVTCSGYSQQQVCLDFAGWEITLTPQGFSPFLINMANIQSGFMGDFVR